MQVSSRALHNHTTGVPSFSNTQRPVDPCRIRTRRRSISPTFFPLFFSSPSLCHPVSHKGKGRKRKFPGQWLAPPVPSAVLHVGRARRKNALARTGTTAAILKMTSAVPSYPAITNTQICQTSPVGISAQYPAKIPHRKRLTLSGKNHTQHHITQNLR